VADRCEAVFDRRFLIEEGFEAAQREIAELVEKVQGEDPDRRYELNDLTWVHPVETPKNSPLTGALTRTIESVLGRPAELIASPGTYDHKHVAQIAGVEHCVAYGPGILELAHQIDEYCSVDDIIGATKVLALAIVELAGPGRSLPD
jgi:succinyl-diaminopimelate desuccinylase